MIDHDYDVIAEAMRDALARARHQEVNTYPPNQWGGVVIAITSLIVACKKESDAFDMQRFLRVTTIDGESPMPEEAIPSLALKDAVLKEPKSWRYRWSQGIQIGIALGILGGMCLCVMLLFALAISVR